jgi:DNA-binding CsgD family transcriptional regulator
VRADGGVDYANEAFLAIVRRADGVALRKGAIEFTAADARARLEAAIGAARGLHAGEPRTPPAGDFPVSRSAGAPPYLASVRPLLDKSRRRVATDAVAIVFIRDPLRRHGAEVVLLRDVFGLTDAEANLAQALQAGLSLADYARAHAVSLNTVYTHLRRIKEKTGCNRLAELIRKLNDLQVPLRLD